MKNADKIKLFAFDVDGTLTNGRWSLGLTGKLTNSSTSRTDWP